MNWKKALDDLWFQGAVMQYDTFLREFQLVHSYHQIRKSCTLLFILKNGP